MALAPVGLGAIVEPQKDGRRQTDRQEQKAAVLIVEDEVLIRFALADYLQECGYKVFEAASAAEAIEILASDQPAVDLVFTDVNLAGEMNGFGLAHWVRTNLPGLPFILTSGDSKMAAAAKELCQSEPFVAKPYDFAQLVGQIRSMMAARKAGS